MSLLRCFRNIHLLSPDTVPENSESSAGRRLPLYSNCLKIRRSWVSIVAQKTSQSQRFQLTLLGFCYDQRCPNGPPVHEIIEGHCLIQGFVQALSDCLHLSSGVSRGNFRVAMVRQHLLSISEMWSQKNLEVFAWFPNDCSCFACSINSAQVSCSLSSLSSSHLFPASVNSWHLFLDHAGIFGQLILGQTKSAYGSLDLRGTSHLQRMSCKKSRQLPPSKKEAAKNPSCPRCPFHVQGSHISSLAIPKKPAINGPKNSDKFLLSVFTRYLHTPTKASGTIALVKVNSAVPKGFPVERTVIDYYYIITNYQYI